MLKKVRLARLIGDELEDNIMSDNYRPTPLDQSLIEEAKQKARNYLSYGTYAKSKNIKK